MKAKIEHPKVFISYAWGTDEYQNKVLSFVYSLIGDGIDVIFDKFDLNAGNDTNEFMEKCVNDPNVTNVLMLLDPVYAKKANNRTGGVGTETQIISAKLYKEVEQTKFIPIVFERDAEGNICKPTYLEGRLHFDLSQEDKYDNEYQRLVKRLYGVEIYEKPELGKKPDWVESTSVIPLKKTISFEVFKSNAPAAIKEEQLRSFLDEIKTKIIEFSKKEICDLNDEGIIKLYLDTESIRDEYLALVKQSSWIDNVARIIADFLEETADCIENDRSVNYNLSKVFIHEIFLYTIAILLKGNRYNDVDIILRKTYFLKNEPATYHIFYCGSCNQILSKAVRSVDNKNYYSGTADLWIKHINIDYCSKQDFVFADLICHNYSVLNQIESGLRWRWFPLTYVYDDIHGSVILSMAKKMMSKEKCEDYMRIFGFDKIDDFINAFSETTEKLKNHIIEHYRYNEAFESAPLLCDFISSDKIASLK